MGRRNNCLSCKAIKITQLAAGMKTQVCTAGHSIEWDMVKGEVKLIPQKGGTCTGAYKTMAAIKRAKLRKEFYVSKDAEERDA